MGLNSIIWGVRLWIWLLCLANFTTVSFAVIYIFREHIRKKYYQIRFPDKLVKIVIHNKTGIYREHWRIIPDDKTFKVGDKIYEYDDSAIQKDNELFSKGREPITVRIEGKTYNVDRSLGIKRIRRKYPEFHYFYNVPTPILFDFDDKSVKFSASQLEDFKENDLFSKLLTLREEKTLLIMILVFVIIGTLAAVVACLKVLNIIKYAAK